MLTWVGSGTESVHASAAAGAASGWVGDGCGVKRMPPTVPYGDADGSSLADSLADSLSDSVGVGVGDGVGVGVGVGVAVGRGVD